MCEAGFWAPDDPVHNIEYERILKWNPYFEAGFVLSSSNLRNDFLCPAHQGDILWKFRESPAEVTGVQNATEAFARGMLEDPPRGS